MWKACIYAATFLVSLWSLVSAFDGHLVRSLSGEVGAENYTYFVQDKFPVRLVLHSLTGKLQVQIEVHSIICFTGASKTNSLLINLAKHPVHAHILLSNTPVLLVFYYRGC